MPKNVTVFTNYRTSDAVDAPVHGVYGGVAPQGHISASFYCERWALPKRTRVDVQVDDANRVIAQTDEVLETVEGVIRTVIANCYFDPDVAESVGQWLVDKAREAKATKSE